MRPDAEKCLRQFRAARADEARHADDFAAANRKSMPCCSADQRKPAHLEHGVAGMDRFGRGGAGKTASARGPPSV